MPEQRRATLEKGSAHGSTVLLVNPGADLYGSDRMLLEAVHAFVAAGRRAVVVLPEHGPLAEQVVQRGGSVLYCPTPIIRKAHLRPTGLVRLAWSAATSVRPALRLLRAVGPGSVYVSTITAPLWLLVARGAGVPTVCHVHEAEAGVRPWLLRAINLPLLCADLVVINSEFSRRTLARVMPRVAGRARVIRNAVEGPDRPSPARAAVGGAPRLVYVGRLSARKGVHTAVSAVAVLRERGVAATLDLVGGVFPGYEWYEESLRSQIHDLGLDGSVRLLGFRADVWPQLAAADIAVVPSSSAEPFGNVAVEALLAQRPVVVSDIGGLPEAVAGFAAAVTVPPDDPAALATAVEQVTTRWSEYRAAAVLARTEAATRYATDDYARHLNDALDSVTPAPA